jgi:hypothetical protein
MDAKPGDQIVVRGRTVAQPDKKAEVLVARSPSPTEMTKWRPKQLPGLSATASPSIP